MFIHLKDVYFSYEEFDPKSYILKDITLSLEKGEFLTIVGPNGSGKSTFSRLLNALLIPQKGDVFVDNLNTKDKANIWEIRKRVGMVFQNPDNQIVASIVENDVAFGLENLGMPSEEIRKRVDEALEMVGLLEFKKMEPHHLSGGQKQRLAIAGILAMYPECIILDEPTSMLDPKGKREVLSLLLKLNNQLGITIILITQDMEEVLLSKRTVGILDGRIVFDGGSREIFNDLNRLDLMSLSLTKVGEIVYFLRQKGIDIPHDILKREELIEFLCK